MRLWAAAADRLVFDEQMSAALMGNLALNDPAKLQDLSRPVRKVGVKKVLSRALDLFGGD